MKNIRLFASVVIAFFPILLYAQEVQLPSVEIKALKNKVPLKVREAVLNNYGTGHQPFAWVSPQTELNTDQWEQKISLDNK